MELGAGRNTVVAPLLGLLLLGIGTAVPDGEGIALTVAGIEVTGLGVEAMGLGVEAMG